MAAPKRLSKVARELNVGIQTIVEFLSKNNIDISTNPNTKIDVDTYDLLLEEFQSEKKLKEKSEKIGLNREKKKTLTIEDATAEDIEKDNLEVQEDEEVQAQNEPNDIPKPNEDIIIKNIQSVSEQNDETIDNDDKEEKGDDRNIGLKIVGKIEIDKPKQQKEEAEKVEVEDNKEVEDIKEDIETEKVSEIDEQNVVEETYVEVDNDAEEEETDKISEIEETSDIVENQVTENVEEAEHAEIQTNDEQEAELTESPKEEDKKQPKVIGKIDLSTLNTKTRPKKKTKQEKQAERLEKEKQRKFEKEKYRKEQLGQKQQVQQSSTQQQTETSKDNKKQSKEKSRDEFIETDIEKLSGPTIIGKIDLPKKKSKEEIEKDKKPVASTRDGIAPKKKRKRIKKRVDDNKQGGGAQSQNRNQNQKSQKAKKRTEKPEISDEDIQKEIKETLAKLSSKGKSKSVKHRRQKRAAIHQKQQEEIEKQEQDNKIIKVNEFVTASELASLMSINVNQVISACMTLGLFVSINQRLDAETITIVAEEFGFQTDFVKIDEEDEEEAIYDDDDDDLEYRPPVVTVMGHVDHGKTKLLDHIRSTNVIAGEAGGITQHIGAYNVTLPDGREIAFLDTPGHEAFTAMRARGAKITDVAIIVIAADDNVMPQTVEAISHAQAANVSIVFAINKIDKPTANPDKIKEELANMDILVEDWGGKYQCQEISAKQGLNVEELLEKVLLEAEMLELKANPKRNAIGTIIESTLDKGRGYVAKLLVQNGTLKKGDLVLAGQYYGRVKALFNERGIEVPETGPASAVLLLGLNGSPQAGDRFKVMNNERETKEIAGKRQQLQREQNIRTQKHITLDEIGRRIAIGNFHELNLIIKGDVDGSVEALSDSLLKLSTKEVQVNIIHKSVGQISESDVLLASASEAIIIGFQVRPSVKAKQLSVKEQVDIRMYSIIYKAIEEIREAMEGMLSPDIKEEISGNAEVRNTFKISKVGTIAGCMVIDGKIYRNNKVRLIRDGIVKYEGSLESLKRFKDDAKEVAAGYECGLNIENYNDLKVGDIIESYTTVEVKKKL